MRTAARVAGPLLILASFGAAAAPAAAAADPGPAPVCTVCSDVDADLVCHGEDNCPLVANGPGQDSNQEDADLDGFGDVCDGDFDDNGVVSGSDFARFVAYFGSASTDAREADFDADCLVAGSDFASFVRLFGKPLTSGLVCAGMVPCVRPTPVDVEGWPLVAMPGNAPDETGHGGVAVAYQIAPHEVTNAEYAAFLDAAARERDLYGLYNPEMAGPEGGIVRTGDEGCYLHLPIAGRESLPVHFVSYLDALRFVNWLHQGQWQEIGTVDDGAYDLSAGAAATRSPRARFHLPDEDEWYKAAYYDAATATWFDQATGSDVDPTCAPPAPGVGLANCGSVVGDTTPVASYVGSPSPAGTFDQAGNVAEWTETTSGDGVVVRGGDRTSAASDVGVTARAIVDPTSESALIGFRVARALPDCDR